MTVAKDGHGASIVLATSHWPVGTVITAIKPDSVARESFDWTNYHTETAQVSQPADLVDPGGFEVEFYDNGDNGTAEDDDDAGPPITKIPEDIAIVYGLATSWVTAPTISGNGYMTEYNAPEAKTGQIMAGSAKFKWAGPLTYTPHSEA